MEAKKNGITIEMSQLRNFEAVAPYNDYYNKVYFNTGYTDIGGEDLIKELFAMLVTLGYEPADIIKGMKEYVIEKDGGEFVEYNNE